MADETIIEKAMALLPGSGGKKKRASASEARQKQLAAILKKLASLSAHVEKLAATIAADAEHAVKSVTPAKKAPARKPGGARPAASRKPPSKPAATTPEPTPPTPTEATATTDTPAEAKPETKDEPAQPDPEAVKKEAMDAELAAFEKAKPVFTGFCQGCHVKGQRNANAKKLGEWDMTSYPFAGKHNTAKDIREVLAIGGGKATMPKGKPGTVKGDDLAVIAAWADAWDAAEAAGAHEAK